MVVFTDPPEVLQDVRQSMFKEAAQKIVEETQPYLDEDFKITNVFCGFYAASVNLGWLQNKIREYYKEHKPDIHVFKKMIMGEIMNVVQRPKRVWVVDTPVRIEKPKIRGIDLGVEIETKDDYGYYHYRFNVRLFQ